MSASYQPEDYHWYWQSCFIKGSDAEAAEQNLTCFGGFMGRWEHLDSNPVFLPGRWWWQWNTPPVSETTGRPGAGAAGHPYR